jgi:hypothetical protein
MSNQLTNPSPSFGEFDDKWDASNLGSRARAPARRAEFPAGLRRAEFFRWRDAGRAALLMFESASPPVNRWNVMATFLDRRPKWRPDSVRVPRRDKSWSRTWSRSCALVRSSVFKTSGNSRSKDSIARSAPTPWRGPMKQNSEDPLRSLGLLTREDAVPNYWNGSRRSSA